MMNETPSTLTTRRALGTTNAMRKNGVNEGWMPDEKTDGTTDEKTDGTTNGTIVRILLQETTTMTDVDMTIGIGAIMMAIDDVVMMRMSAHATVVAQLRPQTGKSDPTVRIWLTSLPEKSVTSWGDLNRKLIESFQATCNRPGNHFNLTQIKQKGDEPLRDYIKRFCAKKTEIPNVPDQQIITAFLGGIHSDDLVWEIGQRNHDLKLTAQECFEIADKYASGESALDDIRGKGKEKRLDKPEPSKKDKKRKPDNAVNIVDRIRKNPRMNQPSTDELLSGLCPWHPKGNHKAKDCYYLKGFATATLKVAKDPPRRNNSNKDKPKDDDDKDDSGETERIVFQVADFESAYHAIIGRPAMARLMAVSHYPYLTLKMPGSNRIISLHSDLQNSFDYNVQSCEMATKQLMLSGQKEIQKVVGIEEQTGTEVLTKKPTKEKIQTDDIQTKEILLDPEDPDKVTYAGVNLDEK
ncbi:hypothetical protein QOZ80_1BG0063430 [Eleusine coracana subsp. coracana]|nr:hypothetical protein QOZ80_1BG0063430 [Eleusine coracana subsp. coracana]